MRIFLLVSAAVLVALVGCDKPATNTKPASSSAVPASSSGTTTTNRSTDDSTAPAPDNTAVNKRDRDASAKTPIDQKENQRDVSITADIRKQILAKKEMSVDARNVKIITADGKVTLRGPVASQEERDAIDEIARSVAGKDNVDNQIEVAAK